MRRFLQRFVAAIIMAVCMQAAIYAQGTFSGSLESNTIYYVNDKRINSIVPSYKVGSNNYLKLDYVNGRFAAGLQSEYYPHPLQGFQKELEGFGVPFKFVSWTDRNWSITAGDFYEQFGSGLVLRSWEDRQLGFNNALGGGRLAFNALNNAIQGKVIYGLPRYYLKSKGAGYKTFSNVPNPYARTQVAGGDLYISLMQLMNPESEHYLALEGSVVNRYEKYAPKELIDLAAAYGFTIPRSVLSLSGRVAYSYGPFSVKGEYVSKGEDFYAEHVKKGESYTLKRGDAQLVEMSYAGNGFSATGTFRRLSNMEDRMFRTVQSVTPGNTINYIPALCQQQTYMLATLNPYTPNADGEIGGQMDIYYNVKRGTALGGKYGMKIHAGGSMFHSTPDALSNYDIHRLAYRDITIDVEKKWSKGLRTIFFVSIQENSPTHGNRKATNAQNVFVVDALGKLSRSVSLRGELQYLYSRELEKDWMAGLLEVNIAPKWSLFVSDMYNHGDTGVHYVSGGVSYSNPFMRLAASYGRNREGMVCSGGVCRWQPAYTGGNLQLAMFF